MDAGPGAMIIPGMALSSRLGAGAGIDIPGIAEWSMGAELPGIVACGAAAGPAFTAAFRGAAWRVCATAAFAFGFALGLAF